MLTITAPRVASSDEIAAFESWLGHDLPQDYRAHLQTPGAGALSIFTVVETVDADLQVLLPLRSAQRHDQTLRSTREALGPDRLTPDVLVVGVDSGGGWFCLGLVPPHRGAVFHWIDDGAAALDLGDATPGIGDLTPVAPDWPSFLACLRETPL